MSVKRYIVFGCPNHIPVKLCECGQNTICYTCGEGSGAAPCQCPSEDFDSVARALDEERAAKGERLLFPERHPDLSKGAAVMSEDFDEPMELVESRRLRFLETLERSIKEHADIWRELAKY